MVYQVSALMILMVFYCIYIGKMIAQSRKGIKTDQMGKGNKPKATRMIEVTMKVATYSIVVIQLISIYLNTTFFAMHVRSMGFIIALMGVTTFAVSVWTMRDSWRAGISDKDKTEMITTGIYSMSRNPAFVGFDLMYMGLLLMFFNRLLAVFTAFAILMLHLQILQEEKFLKTSFGDQYIRYNKKVHRYFGRS